MKDRPTAPPAPEGGCEPYQPWARDRAGSGIEPILLPIWPDGARAIGVGRSLMFELVGDGRIATVKCGRKRLVSPDELRRFAKNLATAVA